MFFRSVKKHACEDRQTDERTDKISTVKTAPACVGSKKRWHIIRFSMAGCMATKRKGLITDAETLKKHRAIRAWCNIPSGLGLYTF